MGVERAMNEQDTQRQLSDELAWPRTRLLQLFEGAPVAVLIAEAGLAVGANRACLRLLGASDPAQLIGQPVCELVHPDAQRALAQLSDAAQAEPEASHLLHAQLLRLDGSLLHVEIALAGLAGESVGTVQMVISDVTHRESTRRELLAHRQELRELSVNVIEAREDERRRIARELHDDLGQRLLAMKMDLTHLVEELHGRSSQLRLNVMMQTLGDTVAALRRIAADLRPLMLDDLGLNAAIEWLARDTARRLGIEVTVDLDETEPLLDRRAATALYRMVQEALTNIGRHAQASQAHIELHRQGAELLLSVQDDGIGFPSDASGRKDAFGLLGMRERALMLGGAMLIERPPCGGGRIAVRLPLQTPPAAGALC